MYLWISSERTLHHCIRGFIIQVKTLELAKLSEIENFVASEKWLNAFIKRFSLKYVSKLHGEGGSVDLSEIAEGAIKIKSELSAINVVIYTMLMKLGFFMNHCQDQHT